MYPGFEQVAREEDFSEIADFSKRWAKWRKSTRSGILFFAKI